MYALLCILVCLAVFLLATVLGALASIGVAGLLGRLPFDQNLRRSPLFLFWLRIFPFALGLLIAAGFALPSFLLLEPQAVETPEPHLLAMAVLAIAAIAVLAFRFSRLIARTSKVSRRWLAEATKISVTSGGTPIYRVETEGALVAVIGFVRPRIFIGSQALASLTAEEFQAAIAHELAHVHSFDNIKRLILNITRLPKWLGRLNAIDGTWLQAAEVAADQAACIGGISALDLGSALLRIARLQSSPREISLIAACHLIPADNPCSLSARVQRLQTLLMAESSPQANRHRFFTPMRMAVVGLSVYLLALPSALPTMHEFVEWLVR